MESGVAEKEKGIGQELGQALDKAPGPSWVPASGWSPVVLGVSLQPRASGSVVGWMAPEFMSTRNPECELIGEKSTSLQM